MVTAVWVFFTLNIMPFGPTAAGFGNCNDAHKAWGNRIFQNTVEQAPIFLGSLWMHALFVDTSLATSFGWMYMAFRAIYPVIWALFSGKTTEMFKKLPLTWAPFPWMFFSTFPQYSITMYMSIAVILKLGFDIDLAGIVVYPLVVIPIGLSVALYVYVIHMVPIVQEKIIAKAFIKADSLL